MRHCPPALLPMALCRTPSPEALKERLDQGDFAALSDPFAVRLLATEPASWGRQVVAHCAMNLGDGLHALAYPGCRAEMTPERVELLGALLAGGSVGAAYLQFALRLRERLASAPAGVDAALAVLMRLSG